VLQLRLLATPPIRFKLSDFLLRLQQAIPSKSLMVIKTD
jgi:hypothetical protein